MVHLFTLEELIELYSYDLNTFNKVGVGIWINNIKNV